MLRRCSEAANLQFKRDAVPAPVSSTAVGHLKHQKEALIFTSPQNFIPALREKEKKKEKWRCQWKRNIKDFFQDYFLVVGLVSETFTSDTNVFVFDNLEINLRVRSHVSH